MNNAIITLHNVGKEYKIDNDVTFVALKDISLEIKKGEFSSILGPSGSGKSTLMHIIGLLDQPSNGIVKINGQDIATLNDNEISSLRNEFVGFVFQQFNLINKLTVLENILLPTLFSRKIFTYNPEVKAMDLLRRFGIDSKANSKPNKISGGQQQRVAIARALIMSPQLILADEPTGNLDTKTGDEIMKLLKELNQQENITVIIVTHEKDIAEKTSRQIKIVDGKMIV